MKALVAAVRAVVVLLAAYGTSSIWLYGQSDGLLYLTNLSALTLAVVTAWSLVAGLRGTKGPPPALRAGVVLVLLVVGLVAATLLPGDEPGTAAMVLGLTYNQVMHVVLPLAALVCFVLLDPHRRLRWASIAAWCAVLVVYLVVVLVAGSGSGGYPYAFLDLGARGAGPVAFTVAVILAVAAALGAGLVALDHRLPERPLLGAAQD